MIVCPYKDLHRYAAIIPGLEEAMQVIDRQKTWTPGITQLSGGNRIVASEGTTTPAGSKLCEAHRQYLDVQYIVEGEETVGWAPLDSMTLDGEFKIRGEKKPLQAKFYGTDKKLNIHNKKEMDDLLKKLEHAVYEITEVKKGERIKNAPLPFTTSTLQQEAAKTLNFSTQKTMRLAQQLYEGIDIKGNGTVGVITYLRTDSTRISEEADEAARAYISSQYGDSYVSAGGKTAKKDQRIQDAHEAIRPTDITRTPAMLKDSLSRDQFRLYQLIWKRFTASRMSAARYETTSVKIGAGEFVFTVAASKVAFDGFMSVYVEEEDSRKGNVLSQSLEKGMKLELENLKPEQHFTQPPAHYTEASLVKALEEQGIGRPSTYAPTITTIISRRYVSKEQKNLYVTELGEVVNNIMKQAFPSIVDVHFTAMMEGLLDCVEAGTVQWKTVIRNFYPDLKKDVDAAEKELEKVDIQDEVTDVICDVCGRNMVIKYGPHGRFLACPGFPECRNTKPYYEKIGVACPKCGKEVVLKKTQKGRKYYGCEDNPECDFMSWQKPSNKKCPVCGSYMVEKGSKLVCSEKTCGYVEQKPKQEEN